MKLTIPEVLQATGGVLLQGRKAVTFRGISTDSRTLQAGDLFIAIAGEKFDGHHFVNEVAKKSPVMIVAKRGLRVAHGATVIYVKDTVKALGEIALAHRQKFKIPLIAITGSTGKTTTKEMVAQVLRTKFRVLSNFGTHNNHIGVPMTLLKLTNDHQIAVLELGTNRCGDIRWLTHVARPTVAVYTNIGESHLELLKTPQGVLREKLELAKNMPQKSMIIVNADNPYLAKFSEKDLRRKIIRFGIDSKADYRATDCQVIKNQNLQFTVNRRYLMSLRTPVMENVYNALAAISCGRLFQISYNDIKSALAWMEFPKGRQAVQRLGDYWLIDDTYNANPVSLRSAIGTLARLKTNGRRILVCADMLELGTKSQTLHSAIGEFVAEANIDSVFTFGKFSRFISATARAKSSRLAVRHFISLPRLHGYLKQYCRPGDAILVKGSRSMHMEQTIDFIKKNLILDASRT